MKIAVVGAEHSSDFLGSRVVEQISQLYETNYLSASRQLEIAGCGGEKMAAKGVQLVFDNSIFSKVGILSILSNFPRLFATRRKLVQYITDFHPDVFLGIDGYSLNLTIEKHMRKADVPVVHLVAPKLLFNKTARLNNIQKYIDELLCLFPFELDDYKGMDVKVQYIGHPMADMIPMDKPTKQQSKYEIGLEPNSTVVAIMPGSRKSLLKSHLPVVRELAKKIRKKYNDQVRIVSAIPQEYTAWYKKELAGLVDMMAVNSTALLAASDVSIVASGTIALEALLCGTPMVVFIRIEDRLTKYLALKTLAGKQFSLPNLLAPGSVKEFMIASIPNDTDQMVDIVSQYLEQQPTAMLHEFAIQHQRLQQHAAVKAAQTVLNYAQRAKG